MFSRIRKRITYANVAMTLALVFAMGGGAYAAGKFIITSTKQIKPSVLAQLKGKNGTNGMNGTNGTNGLQGPIGEKGPLGPGGTAGQEGGQGPIGLTGPAGTNGTNGTPGTPGTNGTNGTNGTPGTNGTTGATGATGATGPQGALQKGATETGTYIAPPSMSAGSGEFRGAFISLPLPLAAQVQPASKFIKISAQPGTIAPCIGGTVQKPVAEAPAPSGKPNLCIYEGEPASAFGPGGPHKGHLTFEKVYGFEAFTEAISTAGGLIMFKTAPTAPPEEVSAEGTFAITP